ncbi:hypothetical protein [Rickettsia helvetica]|uniref:Transposase n=1 Tax=Rickettsia helvetica TaxID=35789 RepID=A0ABM9N9Y9_RICHE|nr:hypothetical protein [Rickettsia helvetica]MCZ6884249.1 hypothetical protein [Rickettsia endosymbiont of Ixodes ricinus]MCZ6897011.1 hypothetical protein [Rickettsia endosymbiont of Ixodes ricinus]
MIQQKLSKNNQKENTGFSNLLKETLQKASAIAKTIPVGMVSTRLTNKKDILQQQSLKNTQLKKLG